MTADPLPPAFTHATGHHGFRDGKYYRFGKTSVIVMAGWPRMLAWKRSAKYPQWQMLRPDCGKPSLQGPVACVGACAMSGEMARNKHCQRGEGDCLLAHDPWRRWSDLIPHDVREAVAGYRSRHWHLLSMAARCGQPAVDLMRSNPALAWALASSWVFRAEPVQNPMQSVRRLLAPGKSQRDILAWLDFPATETARRQLRKLEPRQVSVNALLVLRDALRDPEAMKRLGHLPVLNHGVIRLVADPELRPLASHALLMDIARPGSQPMRGDSMDRSEENYARSAMILQDCLRMMDALGVHQNSLRGLRSRTELIEFHDELTLRFRQQWAGDKEPRTLPPPPLSGTADIVPITTEQDLMHEGEEMKHCVGSYGSLVVSGRVAVYRVLAPERATLAISLEKKTWRIQDLRGIANAEASQETWRTVSAWLKGEQSAPATKFLPAGERPCPPE